MKQAKSSSKQKTPPADPTPTNTETGVATTGKRNYFLSGGFDPSKFKRVGLPPFMSISGIPDGGIICGLVVQTHESTNPKFAGELLEMENPDPQIGKFTIPFNKVIESKLTEHFGSVEKAFGHTIALQKTGAKVDDAGKTRYNKWQLFVQE